MKPLTRSLETPSTYGTVPLTPPVIVALLYAGAMSLFILWLVIAWPGTFRSTVLSNAAWMSAGGADVFRRAYRTVDILLVGFLWLATRSGIGGRSPAIRWCHVGAALLVAATHRALDGALAALPHIHLLAWPMGLSLR